MQKHYLRPTMEIKFSHEIGLMERGHGCEVQDGFRLSYSLLAVTFKTFTVVFPTFLYTKAVLKSSNR